MYRNYPSLYENDCEERGFEWINGADSTHNMISFCRLSTDRRSCLLFHFNFSPVAYPNHRIGALCAGKYHQVLNSDDAVFGGSGSYPSKVVEAEPIPWDGKAYSVAFDVPPYSVSAFTFDFDLPVQKAAAAPRKKTTKSTPPAKAAKAPKRLTKQDKDSILKAIEESGKSLDEIMALLKNGK